jgi:AcrR family transcriptional regulator
MSVPLRSPGPRRAARREEIRRRLMDAVQDQLRAGATYSELPLERLARDAGVSRSRFYVYFEDKGDLLRALTEDVFAELFEATIPWWSLPDAATEADLRAITEHIFEIFLPHKELLAAVVQVASHDAVTREATASAFDQAAAGYALRLAEAQRAGRADPELDPARVVALLSWMTECGLYQLVARAEDTDRHLRALTRIIWNTLYARTRR